MKFYNLFTKLAIFGVIGTTVFGLNTINANAQVLDKADIDNSITIEVPDKSTVMSDCDGKINKIKDTVYIIHDNEPMISVYTNLDEINVEDGQKVKCGEPIGIDTNSFEYQVNVDAILFNCCLGVTKPIFCPDPDPYQFDIADYALQFIGNPYVWGGTSLTDGADCSGFIQSLFKVWNIDVPRTADTQYEKSEHISEDELRKGDLIFYGDDGEVEHVAMYLGDGRVVHASNAAPYPEGGIKITDNYKYRTVVGYGRY